MKLTSKFYEAAPGGQAGVRSTACQAQLRCEDVYHETFPISVPFPLCFLHKQQRRGRGGGWGGRTCMHLWGPAWKHGLHSPCSSRMWPPWPAPDGLWAEKRTQLWSSCCKTVSCCLSHGRGHLSVARWAAPASEPHEGPTTLHVTCALSPLKWLSADFVFPNSWIRNKMKIFLNY